MTGQDVAGQGKARRKGLLCGGGLDIVDANKTDFVGRHVQGVKGVLAYKTSRLRYVLQEDNGQM